MSGAKRVHNEYISQRSKLGGEGLEVFGFFFSETGVLQKHYVAVFHFGNSLLCVFAYDLVVVCEYYVLTEKLGKTNSHGSQAEFLFGTVFGLAEVRAEDNLAAVSDQFFNCGQSSGDSVVIGDHAVLERYVEVNANEHFFALNIDVINCYFVELHSKYILSWSEICKNTAYFTFIYIIVYFADFRKCIC